MRSVTKSTLAKTNVFIKTLCNAFDSDREFAVLCRVYVCSCENNKFNFSRFDGDRHHKINMMHWFKQYFVAIIAAADSLGEIHFAIHIDPKRRWCFRFCDENLFELQLWHSFKQSNVYESVCVPTVYRSAIIFILIWYFIPFHTLIFSLHTSVLAYSPRTHHQIAPSCCKLAFSLSLSFSHVCDHFTQIIIYLVSTSVLSLERIWSNDTFNVSCCVFVCVSVSVLETNRVLFVLFFFIWIRRIRIFMAMAYVVFAIVYYY